MENNIASDATFIADTTERINNLPPNRRRLAEKLIAVIFETLTEVA